MRKFLLMMVTISLVFFLFIPTAKAVPVKEIITMQQYVDALYENQEISITTYEIFLAAAQLYLAYWEGISYSTGTDKDGFLLGENYLENLIENSTNLDTSEGQWQEWGQLAFEVNSQFKAFSRNYHFIIDILEASQLWSPNSRELEVLFFSRQLLDAIQDEPGSYVDRLGRVWEGIVQSYKDEKLNMDISYDECPSMVGLDDPRAEALFIGYSRWAVVNYRLLDIARQRYLETKWAFLDGEGLLAGSNGELFAPNAPPVNDNRTDKGFSWGTVGVVAGLIGSVPSIWLGGRWSRRLKARKQGKQN